MAELADAYDSGSYEATRAGSSPVWCTIFLWRTYEKISFNSDSLDAMCLFSWKTQMV